MVKIYGMIGYSILHNSPLFPNTEILLISDMHNEPIKNCAPSEQINISSLLKYFLDKGYIILLEEIPNKRDVVSYFPDSNHVRDTRELYLENFDKIIGFDIRLDLIDSISLENSELPLITHFTNLLDFFMIKARSFELEITKKYHLSMLIKFKNFISKYIDDLKKKSLEVDKLVHKLILTDLDNILSDIIEFYCFCRLSAELVQLKGSPQKYVINCGLYHSEKIIDIICKQLKYTIKEQHGINKMEETWLIESDASGMCVRYFHF